MRDALRLRAQTRYDEVDAKDNFVAEHTNELGDAEVDLGDVAAGVTVVDIDADALVKGGMHACYACEHACGCRRACRCRRACACRRACRRACEHAWGSSGYGRSAPRLPVRLTAGIWYCPPDDRSHAPPPPVPLPPPTPGVHRFSKDELRANLARRGAETSGDKQALFERLREALREAEGGRRKQLIAHDVVANVLVGAEEAEARLEQLLARKRELVGEA